MQKGTMQLGSKGHKFSSRRLRNYDDDKSQDSDVDENEVGPSTGGND